MMERSDTLLERSIGGRIALKVGLPEERVMRFRGEQHAFIEAAAAPTAGAPPITPCAEVRVNVERVRRWARIGEAGDLREWVARSGKSPEDFVAVERTFQRALATVTVVESVPAGYGAASTPGAPDSRQTIRER